jgi:glucose-6-phosphate 1-dehydrogenase
MERSILAKPVHPGIEVEKNCEPCVIVIFGASGDLTRRKLFPALFNLHINHFLSSGTRILGLSRSFKDHYNFRNEMKKSIEKFDPGKKLNDSHWETFSQTLFYVNGDFNNPSSYENLKSELEKLEANEKCLGNRLYYLATPPIFYECIVEQLGKHGLNVPKNKNDWTRLIVEKPFGHDLESAVKLNQKIGSIFSENQIYRIDHYLGKETVQNLLVFRFGNSIFEPIWNRNYIDHVQITAAETVGVENRADYYDLAGALRDMVQNHMLQVLAHIAMEPPVTFEPDIVRDEKTKVFHAIVPMTPGEIRENTIRAQYGPGVFDKKVLPAYRNETGVPSKSTTETFVALKLFVQNWRWAGVPFYIRTGKRLAKHITEITLVFKRTPHMIFRMMAKDHVDTNILVIRIQPEEGISLCFGAKLPGPGMKLEPVTMDFDYYSAFGTKPSNAYERLLRDCLSGDQTLYARRDEVEALWKIITPILETWKKDKVRSLPQYGSGSWGPKEADDFMRKDGRGWRIL